MDHSTTDSERHAGENIPPEKFEDQIILQSQGLREEILIRTYTVLGRKRDGTANLTINKDSGIAQPTKWYSNSKKQVISS